MDLLRDKGRTPETGGGLSSSGRAWFSLRTCEGAAVVTFLTEMISGHDTAGQVAEVLNAAAENPRLVLDLSRLQFLPLPYLKVLVLLHRRMAENQRTLRLIGLHPGNSLSLKRTRLDTLFHVVDDLPAALR